jgi:hypothetical protein
LFRVADGIEHYATMDRRSGAKGDDYPQECVVEDCLITMTGRDEKQTAPIQISMSYNIRVSYCSVYDVPRAGINISEGTFGGHVIEYCDVFNTVLETGDHGSFNSWGRDRFWNPDVKIISDEVDKEPGMQYWDILAPTIIRNSRWRCDHGWDIDLDDGSSSYRIYNNLLLNGGLKMREGFDRIATNNIIVNNTLHPHVWVRESGDVFKHNIVFGAYRPARMTSAIEPDGKWGKELDYNLFVTDKNSMTRFAVNGADHHSITGNPMFIDSGKGDFCVADQSPALRIGFRNFDMTDFGVRSKKLKAIAKTPVMPVVKLDNVEETAISVTYRWLGATLREPQNDEFSAFGVKFDEGGIALSFVPDNSEAAQKGLKVGDLIQSINGIPIRNFNDLRKYIREELKDDVFQKISIIRNQHQMMLEVMHISDKEMYDMTVSDI